MNTFDIDTITKEGFVNGYLVKLNLPSGVTLKFKFPTGKELSEFELEYAISEHLSELANNFLSDAQEHMDRGEMATAKKAIDFAKMITMLGHRRRMNDKYGHDYTAIDLL